MKYSTPLLLLAIMGIIAYPAEGQRRPRRSSLWISGGAELAYTTVECSLCNEDAVLGPAGFIQIGGSPSQKALIAIEFSYWRSDADTTAQEYGLAMVIVRYYPSTSLPLFLSGGLGVGRYAEERVPLTGRSWALSAHGFAIQLGAGYEMQLSERLKFGPMVRYVSALGHKVKRNQFGDLQDMTGRWLKIGAQITWR